MPLHADTVMSLYAGSPTLEVQTHNDGQGHKPKKGLGRKLAKLFRNFATEHHESRPALVGAASCLSLRNWTGSLGKHAAAYMVARNAVPVLSTMKKICCAAGFLRSQRCRAYAANAQCPIYK